MKAFQLLLAVILFCLSCVLCVTQIILTKSLMIGGMFALFTASNGVLLRLSWHEFKEEEES